jgi:hypothetical protein
MTRTEYLQMRNSNRFDSQFIYDYYIERFDKEKHKSFLTHSELFQYLNVWFMTIGKSMNDLLESIIIEFDLEFNLVKLVDKDNNIIKFL